jgi:cytochrome P450
MTAQSSRDDVPPPVADVIAVGPVRRVTMASGDVGYLVTRYEDVRRVLTDPAFSRAATTRPGGPKTGNDPLEGLRSLFDMDPPEHTRLRGLVARTFTRGRVEALRPWIRQIVNGLMAQMIEAGPPADLVEAMCAPLPVIVICQLLGVPYGDRDQFREWAEAIAEATNRSAEQVGDAIAGLGGYLSSLIAIKQENPADDLLSALARQPDGLSGPELIVLAGTLLIAGHQTTLYQLGKSMYTLLDRISLYEGLRADPGLVPSAVEELLRIGPASPGTGPRVTIQDVEIDGVAIPAGSAVTVSSTTANRDPGVFTDPGQIQLSRDDGTHLTFGHGTHFCLGASLARAELSIAIDGLVRRFPQLRLADERSAIPWRNDGFFSAPMSLPVTW